MTPTPIERARPAWRTPLWATLAAVLLLPLLAPTVTQEVSWSAWDFVAAALLLGATGFGVELAMRARTPLRVLLAAAVVLAAALLWVQGAVGLV